MHADPNRAATSPGNRLLEMMTGYWLSQAIHVAAQLEVADSLASEATPIEEIAQSAGCQADPLYRLLRALAAHGIGQEHEGRRFSATPLSDVLRRDAPHSLWAMAMMIGGEHYRAWGELLQGVRDSVVPFEQAFGVPVFTYFDRHPEASAIFHRAMTEHAMLTHRAAVAAYDFAPFRTVVDIGGGHGALLATILAANSHLKGVLFDQSSVIEQLPAENPLHAAGVTERCSFVGGDFFQEVPAGGDVYVMSAVIHDWNDDQAAQILTNVARALPAGGKLLLVERVVAGPNEPDFAKLGDLNMMVMTGGRERSRDEFAALLERSGLRLSRVLPTRSASSIVEAELRDA